MLVSCSLGRRAATMRSLRTYSETCGLTMQTLCPSHILGLEHSRLTLHAPDNAHAPAWHKISTILSRAIFATTSWTGLDKTGSTSFWERTYHLQLAQASRYNSLTDDRS